MSWAIGPQHAAAQLAATIAFADGAAGPSVIRFYTTGRPATGADPGGAHQLQITMAKPCATLSGGVLTLHPADPEGALVLSSGIPRWARWERSDALLVGDCNVTDMAGDGQLKLAGGVTPPGDNSPQLYAGGIALLGAVELT